MMWRALVLFFAVGCTRVPTPNYDYTQERDPRKEEYVLGVGDRLAITTDAPATSVSVTVRPDGIIAYPRAGEVRAAGMTPAMLRIRLQELLLENGGTPQDLSVVVTEVRGYRFAISGAVARPGLYAAEAYLTVTDGLAMAGGFAPRAKRNAMWLLRRDPQTGAVRRIPLVFDLLASGKRPDMNLFLLPGDSLFVP